MMEKKPEKRALGRGLSALMADISVAESAPQASQRRPDMIVPVESVVPNADQPRRDFAPEALAELAESIRQKGIIQPLVVRRNPRGDGYEIVAGERRWRAAQMASLHEVPVVLRDFSDSEVIEIAIIENIQRADLNAVEEAMAFRQLMDKFGHTQEKLAEALSKSRSYVANLLRLLNLPADVQTMVRDGTLSAGHARALITAEDPSALARAVVARGLSVRETEKLAREASGKAAPRAARPRGQGEKDADTRALEGDLSANLAMSVTIDHDAGSEGGRLTIRYGSLDDLDLLCRLLTAMPADVSR